MNSRPALVRGPSAFILAKNKLIVETDMMNAETLPKGTPDCFARRVVVMVLEGGSKF
jgi:hypothetical protein